MRIKSDTVNGSFLHKKNEMSDSKWCAVCQFRRKRNWLWPPCVADACIIFLTCGFYLLFSSPNLSRRRLDCLRYFHTWCGPSANLECRSEMCCTRLAGNAGPKKPPKIRHLGTIAQCFRVISSQLRHVSTIGTNLLNSIVSSTCPHNMVNGPLAAVIRWRVWGTPANFNGFRVLAALLHGTLVVGISETLRH